MKIFLWNVLSVKKYHFIIKMKKDKNWCYEQLGLSNKPDRKNCFNVCEKYKELSEEIFKEMLKNSRSENENINKKNNLLEKLEKLVLATMTLKDREKKGRYDDDGTIYIPTTLELISLYQTPVPLKQFQEELEMKSFKFRKGEWGHCYSDSRFNETRKKINEYFFDNLRLLENREATIKNIALDKSFIDFSTTKISPTFTSLELEIQGRGKPEEFLIVKSSSARDDLLERYGNYNGINELKASGNLTGKKCQAYFLPLIKTPYLIGFD
jgi:hypothetical protein